MIVKTFGEVDERSLEQLQRCAEFGDRAVLCADHHPGYSQPIGGAIGYEDLISPSGVGFDIACGNCAVRTPLKVEDVDISAIMDEIFRRVSFGMGRKNKEPVDDHSVFDKIRETDTPAKDLLDLAQKQLGTVGGGNHYVDLFEDDEGYLWIGVHFGSRGFGHKIASGFMALAQGKSFTDKADEGGMDAPPILLSTSSAVGEAYVEAMGLAGEYAYAGRNTVVSKVLQILGSEATYEVHNHHNFAWRENHAGVDLWVVRKGCTPAFPGQEGFVGGSMGDVSVILEGQDSGDSQAGLYSTVHGAGRVMSRTKAAGKVKRRKKWRCMDRDCPRWFDNKQACPDHPEARTRKEWVNIRKSEGLIDWEATRADLRARNIELRGGGPDEAPGVYKRLPEVLKAHGDTIQVKHTLTPVGIAMAGMDEFDPYKD